MNKLFPKLLNVFLVLLLVTGNFSGIAMANVTPEQNQIVQVTKEVNPTDILEGGDAEVTVKVKGSSPVNFVMPNDIILIIDRSGSMHPRNNAGEDKMGNAKLSAQGFVDLVDFTKHRIGVVDFSTTISELEMSTDKNNIKNYIGNIQADGGTATGDAIAKSREILKNHRPDAQPVIVLMTDGKATHINGRNDTNAASKFALEQANAAKAEGIVFYTIALLDKGDTDPTGSPQNLLLKEMATTARHHHFVLGSVGLKEIYAAIVKEIGLASAYDVTVQDFVAPGFEIVPGSYENNIPRPVVNGNQITWKFNELKEELLTFTYKIRHKKGTPVGKLPVGDKDIDVAYTDYLKQKHQKTVAQPSVTVGYPAPIISLLEKDNGLIEGGEKVIITGENFRPNPKVMFGTTPALQVEYTNSSKLVVTAPPGVQGNVDLTVTNDDNQSAKAVYRYYAQPEITSVTPNEGPVQGNNDVTINGKHFMQNVKVQFENKPATVISVTDTMIKVKVPTGDKNGTVSVSIENVDGTKAVLNNAYSYVEGPAITTITPNVGTKLGGETITVTGTNFKDGTVVKFKEQALQTQYVSPTEVKAVTPAWAKAEAVDVTVANPDGQFSVLSGGFTYENPTPILTSVSPNQARTNESVFVTVKGEHFLSGAVVKFKDKEVVTSLIDSNTLRVTSPTWTIEETVDFTVVNPDGKQVTLTKGFSFVLPEQFKATAITPASGSLTGGEVVTITGEKFPSNISVYFNDKKLQLRNVADTKIMLSTPTWPTPGKVDVKLVDGYGREVVLAQAYEYLAPPKPAAPTLTSVTPNTSLIAGGVLVTVKGENFQDKAELWLNAKKVDAVSFIDKTQLRFRTPAWNKEEVVDIKVVNPDGQEAILSKALTYALPEQFKATAITPASGSLTGGEVVTITGEKFPSDISVYFNDKKLLLRSIADTRITFSAPAWATAGKVDVKLVDGHGREGVLAQAYEYLAPPKLAAPTLTSITPNTSLVAGGVLVTVKGDNFQDKAELWLNTKKVDAVSFIDKTQLRFRTPMWNKEEIVDIKVVNPDGQEAALSKALTYVLPEQFKAGVVTPAMGLLAGGDDVSITGEKIPQDISVYFNDKKLTLRSVTETKITLRTPAWATAGKVDVKLVDGHGREAILAQAYEYLAAPKLPAPVIASVSPNSVLPTGGTFVVIKGENFKDGAEIWLNGTKLPSISVLDATQLRFRSPVWTKEEHVSVKVVNPDGQEAILDKGLHFQAPVLDPAPIITKLNPAKGEIAGGYFVIIEGENFTSGSKVFFNEKPLAASFLSAKQLRITAPAWANPEAINVKVVNPDGQEIIAAGGFEYVPPAPKPAPKISKIDPGVVPYTISTFVVINGENFNNQTTVKINDVKIAASFLSDKQLRIRTPLWSGVGKVTVSVTNPDGQSDSAVDGLEFILPPPPAIQTISPNSAQFDAGVFVHINGSNFTPASKVYFNDTLLPTSYLGDTQLRVRTPVWPRAESVTVRVVNEDGQETSVLDGFTFKPAPPKPAPVITTVTPNTGAISGGYFVFVNGENFMDGAKVSVGNATVAASFLSSKQLRFRMPSTAAPGAIDIKVINPDGQEVVLSGGFTFN
ncbi:IPT/TIG domain-containing protein [Paenibacillus sp. 481]|uniref:IPT/TIG domain-containing protein n=1 Tax=Paenibacillus sp. 481 TaxID=2835869 RepID=UPI001E2F4725|nr:IPT/TIG domain-containing protein [Paenibacillus sp. 481]UHA75717.1 IPT/TIG domain-containing protein [Paenibacillus sp. 481]